MHVPQRHQAFESIAQALKPDGWVVIEDFEARLFDLTLPTTDVVEAARCSKMLDALAQLMEERGFEREWPRGLYRRLKAAGLTDVGMEGHVAVREGGSPGAALLATNIAQVRNEAVAKGLVTDAEVDAVMTRLNEPDFALFSPVMFTAWGRRPRASASASQAHD